MKKITSSYSLPPDLYEEIEKYRVNNRLSSKSQALERMLLERKFMLEGVGSRTEVVVTEAPKPVETKPKKKKESKIKSTITNIMDNMPD